MRIYLVRHGQSHGNVHFTPGVARPKTDPLTKLGLQQAHEAALVLKSQVVQPTTIISSPYTRTLDTAKVIQDTLRIPLTIDDRLREYFPGDWDGVHEDEFRARFNKLPAKDRYTFRPPNGESWLDEAQRLNQVIEQANDSGQTSIVLVSHRDPIRAVVALLTKQPNANWEAVTGFQPGSVTILDKSLTDWMLQ